MSAAPVLRKAKVADPQAAAAAADAVCDHCGDALAGLKVERRRLGGAARAYCCLGCAFIAEQLFLARSGDGTRAALDQAVAPAPAATGAADDDGGARCARAQIDVHGMVCAACALLIEHRIRRLPGVADAQVDFAAARADVAFDAARIDAPRIAAAIRRAGYATEPKPARSARIELLRVLIAWLMMMQVMMLAVPAYVAAPGDIPADVAQLLRIAQLVLTLPVLLFSAAPLWRAAANQVRAGRSGVIGMDLPIAVGLAAAFGASAWATATAQGAVYFDSVTMFVALVLGVRWLQARALARARRFVDDAGRRTRLVAQRLRAWPGAPATDAVPAEELRAGDHLLVAPGDTVAADGVVASGASTVSQAWLTGEATPLVRREGMPVLAGSLNLEQPLVLRVTRAGEATSLAALRRLVDAAGRARPPVVELASGVARAFLGAVLVIAAITLIGWAAVDPAQALPHAIAVLVATCPCALSLAAPAALAATQSALARRGVLVARMAALERLAQVDSFACDKTGTLTAAAPRLARVVALRDGQDADRLLALAAGLESLSNHPYARALQQAARTAGVAPAPVADGRVQASAGVQARVDGRLLRLGTADHALALGAGDAAAAAAKLARRIAREALAEQGAIVLADADGPLALFAFDEAPRPDAAALVRTLQAQGADVLLVSGDRRAPVQRLAALLGIERFYAQQTPRSKRELVAQLQQAGRKVAMLGDGINDAPVLAQADVSFALADGNALAQARADFIVLSSRLEDVGHALAAARHGMRIVRENLGWAFAYNVIAIPLAAFGYLTPVAAAVGMAASSALVVGNALRAARVPPPRAAVRP